MSKVVWTVTDWDPLEEIILGTAQGLAVPDGEISLRHFFEPPAGMVGDQPDPGTLRRVVSEAEEDFAGLSAILEAAGVTVRRPGSSLDGRRFGSPHWDSSAMHALMPRDCLAVTGSTIIEVPMAMRARYFETFPFRTLLGEYFDAGATWLSAPKPELADQTYIYEPGRSVIADEEPLFDGANLLRCGSDIFFNVSNTGNRRGARWLARVLGPGYRIHEMSICSDHVGTTLHVLRPGLLLANSERLRPQDIPQPLRAWDVIWAERPGDDGYAFSWPRASVWIGMNILSLGPDSVLVPDNQHALMRQLEEHRVEPVPVRFRHGRTFGGGLHCCSLDIRRRGELVSYV